jgi:cardiolipin synthase
VRRAKREDPRSGLTAARQLANQVFSRASGAHLREGNSVRLLKDAAENYPAWLAAIAAARQTIHFEMYIIHEDEQGRLFADALLRKAAEGVQVRLLYDWMGGFGAASRAFWNSLRAGGISVRCYNPPRLDQPLGWVSRDHRKVLVIDGTIAFVTGLCVGRMWAGDPAANRQPWRDTGVEVRGPAVSDIAEAFAEAWATCGEPLPDSGAPPAEAQPAAGDVAARVVATVPNTAGLFRVDQLVAAMARYTLWLTDAYYAGTTSYVQALRAAVADGVDVRLLVPGVSDVPVVSALSRAGYRPLIEAGVRVFEWNGPMLHAKTAVADERWARVGSTNLNLASWMGNRELDLIVENQPFARQMQEMFLHDLANATEVVLHARSRARAPSAPKGRRDLLTSGGGSRGRVAAGAMRIGSTVSAAITNRRVLDSIEANVPVIAGLGLAALAALAFAFPRGFAYPVAAIAAYVAAALLYRGVALYRERRRQGVPSPPPVRRQEETHAKEPTIP